MAEGNSSLDGKWENTTANAKEHWSDDQAYQLLKKYERILKPKELKHKYR